MTEEQPYTVVKDLGSFEIRHYPQYVLAQTTVSGDFMRAGNIAFGPLVSYISGNNRNNQKIAMTAPVLQHSASAHEHTVSFVLPAGMDVSSIPLPANSRVSTQVVAAHDVAAIKFGGGWNAERFERKGAELERLVAEAGLVTEGGVYFARFDPPWKPWFLKRNEALIALAPTDSTP